MLRRLFWQLGSLGTGRRKLRTATRRGYRTERRAFSAERLEARWHLSADPIVSVATNFGDFQIELLPGAAPQSVANFLSYVNSGAYANTIFHRSEQPSASNPGDIGIIQTGGFTSASPTFSDVSQFQTIAANAAIPLEYNLPNAAGTVAMARLNAANTATDQFFINDIDNTTTLGAANNGGYAVFGKILGNGMQVVNQIAALTTVNQGGAYAQLPLGPNNKLAQISSITLDSIDGTVFSDANSNAQQDTGEAGVAGRTVFVDANGNGTLDSGEASATTDANGNYTFSGLAAGNYTVREVLPAGTSLTTGAQSVTVSAASTVTGANFGEAPPSITGTVFLDYNSNGQLDAGEQGIAGRTVFINKDNSGAPSANNPSTTTDASGNYSFDALPAGSYTVMEVAPANVSQTLGSQTVQLAANHTTAGVNLGERPAIIGTVFNDVNIDGKLDAGERGLAGVTVFLDVDGSGAPGTNNPSTVTSAQGTYAFEGQAAGSYAVREVIAPNHGTTLTTPAANSTVAAGQTATANFGNALTSTLAPLPVSVGAPAPSSDANTAFINGVFFRLLGHAADSAGLSYWQGQLSDGVSHDALVEGVWNSAEHRGLQVEQFYQTFLGRASDAAGKKFWVDAFNSWGTEKIEAAGFLTSQEYSQKLHASDSDFVDALYQDIALRAADPAGAAFWTSALTNGKSRLDVALAFINGQEASARVVDAFYSDFLHRTADPTSQQAFVSNLVQDKTSVRDVGVNILGSDEYFNGVARQ